MSRLANAPRRRRRRRAPVGLPAPVHDLDGMLRRLHLPTVRRLYGELASRAEAESMSYRTYLETLVAEEIAHRAETRLSRAVRKARFPFLRTGLEDCLEHHASSHAVRCSEAGSR